VARRSGWAERLGVGWSGMRGAVSLAAAPGLPQDFLKRIPIPDGPIRAVLGVQVRFEGADERVAAERVHEQES
jgi:NhaP-type Na+/H+ or K+/H+ antiporter